MYSIPRDRPPCAHRHSLRNRLAALLLLLVSGSIASAASDPSVTVQRYLDGLAAFEADFRQQVRDSRGKVGEQASGRVYLKKPGRFRWEYRHPNEQLIVSDGRNLWLYDKDLEQVTVKSVDESLSSTPALLLAGQVSVTDSYVVKDAGRRDSLDWLELTPRRNDTDFVFVALGFERGSLRAMELQDKLGQHTRIDFSAVKRNPQLAEELFAFQPPAGVDVIGSAR